MEIPSGRHGRGRVGKGGSRQGRLGRDLSISMQGKYLIPCRHLRIYATAVDRDSRPR